jgi:hypothetical protein
MSASAAGERVKTVDIFNRSRMIPEKATRKKAHNNA